MSEPTEEPALPFSFRFSSCRFPFQTLSALLFAYFWCCCLIAYIEQHFDFVIRHTAIQCNGNPAVLPHMIGWKKAVLHQQRACQNGTAFQVDSVYPLLTLQSELAFRQIHDHRKPFLIAAVAEHLIIGIMPYEEFKAKLINAGAKERK